KISCLRQIRCRGGFSLLGVVVEAIWGGKPALTWLRIIFIDHKPMAKFRLRYAAKEDFENVAKPERPRAERCSRCPAPRIRLERSTGAARKAGCRRAGNNRSRSAYLCAASPEPLLWTRSRGV